MAYLRIVGLAGNAARLDAPLGIQSPETESAVQVTAEISLYPLREEYIPIIKDFVYALRRHEDLILVTNAMSTQVSGEHGRVFDVLAQELRASVERHGQQVLVCKFIAKELAIREAPVL